ncbi:MAG: hypothetical protein JO011_18365 [Ktedonobacteraceae bacterium]|nr:hypothetical protein [Ktedonobacteraceae bacterium]MBV9712869.1 hypothetical protein [Ktedonobacteraceae bacterium]
MKDSSSSISRFASTILGKPLYPYQAEVADAILASIFSGQGRIFTVMMSRQSGKNQLSAVLEAFLLTFMRQGTIVKAAPTFNPQIINSRLRLLSLLDTPFTRDRVWQSQGHIIGLAPQPHPSLLRTHAGPRVMFFSAGPESNVVGATADLLLEIDEAQDVAREKFERDFRPMASTRNATTVLYGTAWSDATLLAQQRAANLELERRTGQRHHFEYDWHTLAAINSAYRSFVEQEIARLGADHPAIQTQYLLQPISSAGYFLNTLQRTLLQGTQRWQEMPQDAACYIAGMDVAGEERSDPLHSLTMQGHSSNSRRDSTVVTIAHVHYNEFHLPIIEVVHHEWWTGLTYMEQYARTLALIDLWSIRSLAIDATGLGAGLASLLLDRFGNERIIPFIFTRSSKSRLAYQLLALLNSNRLKLYASAGSPQEIYTECWRQLHCARYSLPGPDMLNFYVDPADGHDDFLCSLALLSEALHTLSAPAASTLIRPVRLYTDEGYF